MVSPTTESTHEEGLDEEAGETGECSTRMTSLRRWATRLLLSVTESSCHLTPFVGRWVLGEGGSMLFVTSCSPFLSDDELYLLAKSNP